VLLLAQAALAQEDAWTGFANYFRATADAYGRSRVLLEAKDQCRDLPQFEPLTHATHEIVRRAQAAGTLRDDLTAEEIFELLPAASRFPDVILDGLCS